MWVVKSTGLGLRGRGGVKDAMVPRLHDAGLWFLKLKTRRDNAFGRAGGLRGHVECRRPGTSQGMCSGSNWIHGLQFRRCRGAGGPQ